MYYRNEPDDTLVMLTLAGEQTAYEILVTRYQRAVVSSALSVTKNRFMAEDAAQDAFVTAWMKLNTLQEPKKYASWVCRIAKNCALNMLGRYRSLIPLELVDNTELSDDGLTNPEELYALSEERNEVNKSIEMLPEKIRQIIHLHYFEELSIAEIADRMRLSEGTVKWQLHDGRKRIRKELCAMDEKYSDTLVQRVMKKVEELKLWQVKNDKSGFEKVYREVLRDVEELPECKEKQHALADVLMRGWWWLPGKKNDALFARIAEAATEGKNEEVMTFILTREDSAVYGGARIEFMRDRQIPRLERAGFVKALGYEWFWLAHQLFSEGRIEEGNAAFDRVESILQTADAYRILVPYARRAEMLLQTDWKGKPDRHYYIHTSADEYRYMDGTPRYWSSAVFAEGWLPSVNKEMMRVFRNASRCDGRFFAALSVGETLVGTDGTTLTYVAADQTAKTPMGAFDGCQLWETRLWDQNGKSVFRTYYKEGVGIVRHEHRKDSITEVCVLKAYEVSGKGLLPFEKGNTWEYAIEQAHGSVMATLAYRVAAVCGDRVMLACDQRMERLGYDENSWLDMIAEIRSDYCAEKNGRECICDVSHAAERAEQLAKTPMEKAHTKAAVSTVRRIMATDAAFNPEYTAEGHWNFFSKNFVQKKRDTLYFAHDHRWSFEWKGGWGAAGHPILFNDVYGILQDATNSLWSSEWRIGASPIVEYTNWSREIRTQIVCEAGGTVTTKAGTFENCMRLVLDIGGMTDGWSYRGGKKVYYFADGVGIVRAEHEYSGGVSTAVYELTAYEGTGEGYMPMADGLMRRYDAIGLTDGYVGSAVYTYVADEDGDIVIFADRTGIRELPPPITEYGAIFGEVIEEKLWEEKKWKEGHLKYASNQFHLLLHMMARPSRNRANAKRSVELSDFYMSIMTLLAQGGEVPPAWYGMYAWTALVKSAALFGDKQTEAGYATLETAVDYCERIAKFTQGDLLDTGKEELLGGIRLVYGKGHILLPDGSREPISYDYRMDTNAENVLYALTARSGWGWFDSVRHEDRFKAYIERLGKIVGKA